MAHNLVEKGFASVQYIDSAKKLASASFYVSPADARAYLAAADAAARVASDVGVLLLRAKNIARVVDFPDSIKVDAHVGIDWVSDNVVAPGVDQGVYNSNKWKITGTTTNGGLPAIDTVYVPEYLLTGVVMESNGINADLTDPPVSDFVTAFVATALSKFNTAFTTVISISRNDS